MDLQEAILRICERGNPSQLLVRFDHAERRRDVFVLKDRNNRMKEIDEYDIRSAFEVLSDQKGGLTLNEFHTLFLGLGYQPYRLTVEELQRKVRAQGCDDCIPLEAILKILSQHSRNRNDNMDACFHLLDSSSKGYLNDQDLQKLAQEVGATISQKQAKRMVSFCSSDGRVDRNDFFRLLSPPEP